MKRQPRLVDRAQPRSACSLGLVVLIIFGVSCSGPGKPIGPTESSNPARYMELRRVIKKNFHYNFECWCTTADPDTVTAVRAQVTDRDITILVELMGDEDDRIGGAASSVITKFGEQALPALRDAANSKTDRVVVDARTAIGEIEGEMRRRTPVLPR